jgi:serine/threonine-protein kinase
MPTDAAFCAMCGGSMASPVLGDTLVGEGRGSGSASSSWELAPEKLQAALGTSYELGRLLGRGGYAEVFAIRDTRLKRELAVKVLRPDLILTEALVARFRREAEAVAALEHPNIVSVYDVGERDGICWLVMPLVRGETLKSRLAREQRLAVPEARRILVEAASALQAAHAAGVVHRDIKPENLMLESRTGRVLLMDFGIAKAMDTAGDDRITGTGVVIGTPQDMSPEQAMGSQSPDPRSDQYSLAVVGYNTEVVPSIAEVPTCQKTLAARAPPERMIWMPLPMVSEEAIWKIQTSVELPARVRLDPVIATVLVNLYRPGTRVSPPMFPEPAPGFRKVPEGTGVRPAASS